MVVSSLRSSTPATRTSGPGAFWSLPLDGLFAEVAASVNGLSADEAARRLARDWPNTIEGAHPHRGLRLLLAQFTSPIGLILVAATVLSMALGDAVDGLVILVISAGDVVPADCRVIESHGLLIDEAALTGESYPVEKRPGVVGAETPLAGRANSLFMGTHVVSGTGQAIVVTTGRATEFGAVSEQLGARRLRTGFERGITAFGVLLVRAMVVLVSAIFVINLVLHRPWSNRCCSRWRWPSASPRSCCPPS